MIQEGFEPPTHGLEETIDTYYTFNCKNIVYILIFLFQIIYLFLTGYCLHTLLQLKMQQLYLSAINDKKNHSKYIIEWFFNYFINLSLIL